MSSNHVKNHVQKYVSRFMDSSNVNNNNGGNTSIFNKHEIQPNRNAARDQDNEKIEPKMQSHSSMEIKSSSSYRSTNSTEPPPSMPPKKHSHPNMREVQRDYIDTSHISLTDYMSSNKALTSKESSTSSLVSAQRSVQMEPFSANDVFVKSVLEKGEYLVKHDNWHSFRGPTETKKFSSKVIEKNENVWEFIKIEYNYFKLLVNIKEVYYKAHPLTNKETSDQSNNLFESIESILPGIDQMIFYHSKITDVLIDNHVIRDDRVISDIGKVMNESVPEQFIPVLAQLYGAVNFAKNFCSEKLMQIKAHLPFLQYIEKCEKDPRCDKKTVSDILLVLSMHWTKKLTPLASIINNTMNDSPDLQYLLSFKKKVDDILNGASNEMDNKMNLKYLKDIVEKYEVTSDESERAYKFMTARDVKLIFYGDVTFETMKNSSSRVWSKEVKGMALEGCIFFLQTVHDASKGNSKYQLYKDQDSAFPAILQWGEVYGYFREEEGKSSNVCSFYVIVEKPTPCMVRLSVKSPLDLPRWKQCMVHGFSRRQNENIELKEAVIDLQRNLNNIDHKWSNTLIGIDLLKELDKTLRLQLEFRTVGFRCLLEEELKRLAVSNSFKRLESNNSTTTITDIEPKNDDLDYKDSPETYLPDLTTPEGIQDWLDVFIEYETKLLRLFVNRLKFSLCSTGANITRSASEIEARKRPSVPTVKKCETFSSRESPNNEKRQTDVTFLNPPITKQKKDHRRISVPGLANLFRINSKSVKNDEFEKKTDSSIMSDTNQQSDKDSSVLESLEMISESDYFMMGLSKDTVTAFNEINIAAKNITSELLRLRSKNAELEANLIKARDEYRTRCEFIRKYVKQYPEKQFLLAFENCNKSNSEIGNSHNEDLKLHGIHEKMVDGSEAMNENHAGAGNFTPKIDECKIQTENLREKYKEFENEKKIKTKEFEAQRSKNAKDREANFEKSQELQRKKEELDEKERKYTEKCKALQDKMDTYTKIYNINFEDENLDISAISIAKNQKRTNPIPNQRSHSNDGKQNRTSKQTTSSYEILPPTSGPTDAAQLGTDPSLHTDNLHPVQLKGSLINQSHERQSIISHSPDINLRTRDKLRNIQADNTGYEKDDKSDSSDVEPSVYTPKYNIIKKTTVDIVEKRTVINSKAILAPDNGNQVNRTSVITHTKSDATSNKTEGLLGIPIGLAVKSKLKSKKTK